MGALLEAFQSHNSLVSALAITFISMGIFLGLLLIVWAIRGVAQAIINKNKPFKYNFQFEDGEKINISAKSDDMRIVNPFSFSREEEKSIIEQHTAAAAAAIELAMKQNDNNTWREALKKLFNVRVNGSEYAVEIEEVEAWTQAKETKAEVSGEQTFVAPAVVNMPWSNQAPASPATSEQSISSAYAQPQEAGPVTMQAAPAPDPEQITSNVINQWHTADNPASKPWHYAEMPEPMPKSQMAGFVAGYAAAPEISSGIELQSAAAPNANPAPEYGYSSNAGTEAKLNRSTNNYDNAPYAGAYQEEGGVAVATNSDPLTILGEDNPIKTGTWEEFAKHYQESFESNAESDNLPTKFKGTLNQIDALDATNTKSNTDGKEWNEKATTSTGSDGSEPAIWNAENAATSLGNAGTAQAPWSESSEKKFDLSNNEFTDATDEAEDITAFNETAKSQPITVNHVIAPMSGTITSVPVQIGTNVACGDVLCVMNIMGAENEIMSPIHASVIDVKINPGMTVTTNDVLLSLR